MTSAVAEPLVFKVVVDDSSVAPASSRTQDALGRLGERAVAGGKQFTELRKSTALTRQEILALNYTASDVAASLASGASPFTILLQQGGQVRDAFGGMGNVFSKLASVLTVGRLAFAALAGGVAALGLAAYDGQKRSDELSRAVTLAGNTAALTGTKFDGMATQVAQSARVTVGAAQDVLQAVVATGQVGPGALNAVTEAAARLARVSGRSAQDAAKEFTSLFTGTAQRAQELNRTYNFLSAEQLKFVRQLSSQGRTEEAVRVVAEAFNKTLKDREPGLSTLGLLLETVTTKASAMWAALSGAFRSDTQAEQIDKMAAKLVQTKKDLQTAVARGAGQSEVDGLNAAIKRLEDWLQANRAAGRLGAEDQAKADAERRKGAEQLDKALVDRQVELERTRFNRSQAVAELAREREALADKRALDLGELNATAYMNRRIARERAALTAKEQSVNKEIALEQRRVVETPADTVAQQARIVDLETKRVAITRERAELEDRIKRGELYTPGPDPLESTRQQFLQFERARQAETEKGAQERVAIESDAVHELLQINREVSIGLIRDDRERGRAQIDLEEEQIRRRLDLASMSAQGRKTAEEELARWRVLREQQLSEELKPEYQRQLELYQDLNRYMRKASDDFREGFIDEGREAFKGWVKNGKVETDHLASYIIDRLASIAYDRYLAGAFDTFAKSIFNGFSGGSGSSGSGGGGDWFGEAMAAAGIFGMAGGGTARRGSLHEVNERGTELLTVRGRDYLMMGADEGLVTPAGQWQGGSSVTTVDASTSIGAIGAGVSRAEMNALLQQNNARVEARIRRLIDHGRL